jgi:hypothetical protein
MELSNKIREEIIRMYSDVCEEISMIPKEESDYSHGYTDGKSETLVALSVTAGIPASVMKNIKKSFLNRGGNK